MFAVAAQGSAGMGPPGDETYRPTALARLLHSLPHLNVSLHRVNSTFAPHSEVYLESLGILGSVPAAWLILTLFVLLIYLLTRCCDREHRHSRSISALKVSLAVIAVLCCGAIGLGLYGNDDLHNGLTHLLSEGRRVDTLITSVTNHTLAIELALTDRVSKQLMELKDIFEEPVSNLTAMQQLTNRLNNVSSTNEIAASATGDIRKFLSGITIAPVLNIGEKCEAIRWPLTMGVLSVLLVLCVILLVGVARHSRCALITFSVCGLLAVIASWLMASVYLASTVALSDLCVAPDRYLASEASPKLPPEVLLYYTHCETARANPFTLRLREARNAMESTRKNLAALKQPAIELFRGSGLEPKFSLLNTEVNSAERLIASLTTLVDCRALHGHYLEGTRALCHVGLLGLALMLLSSVLAGLLFTVLVWVDSHTWIYIRKRRDYHQVEETDQYLPPSAASQAIAARTLQRSQGSCYTPDTPPPSYTSVVMHAQPHPHAQLAQNPLEMQSLIDGCDMRSTESSRSSGTAGHLSHIRGHTLGRLPSHNTQDHSISLTGPNNGKYATLSKQCKTLESSDFY